MISAVDVRPGMMLEIDEELYEVLDYHHEKRGRGSALVKLKIRNIDKGFTVEKAFRPEDTFKRIYTEEKTMQYVYKDDSSVHLMDLENFEEILLPLEKAQDALRFVKEGDEVKVIFVEGTPVKMNPPTFVELKVIEAPPGVRGDTVSGGSKNVVLETGLTVAVPLFIEAGDVIKIDTRTVKYVERVKKAGHG